MHEFWDCGATRRRRFLRDRRGNVAIIFALLLTPILTAIGVAMDVGRMGTLQSRLQVAVDLAALSVAVDSPTLGDDALAERARQVIDANLVTGEVPSVSSVEVTRGKDEVTVTAHAAMKTTFASLLHIELVPLTASSNTVWGGNPIELALVLDNTGSMDQMGKLDTLQDAVHDMLDILEAASDEESAVRVSIVPFATQVRMPTSSASASWIDPVATINSSCSRKKVSSWWSWYYVYDCGRGYDFGYAESGQTWNGCIADRDMDYDTTDAAAVNKATKYPAEMCATTRLQTILPLTNDFTALGNKVDSMRADGNTNVTIGVAWGMASLSHQAPLAEASQDGEIEGLKRIMVVLTDGENTQNRFTSNTNAIDDRTERACQSAKDKGIEVYTVRVIDGDRDLLRRCATDDSHYFDVENVSDLLPVFQTIGTRISKLRIAR